MHSTINTRGIKYYSKVLDGAVLSPKRASLAVYNPTHKSSATSACKFSAIHTLKSSDTLTHEFSPTPINESNTKPTHKHSSDT